MRKYRDHSRWTVEEWLGAIIVAILFLWVLTLVVPPLWDLFWPSLEKKLLEAIGLK